MCSRTSCWEFTRSLDHPSGLLCEWGVVSDIHACVTTNPVMGPGAPVASTVMARVATGLGS